MGRTLKEVDVTAAKKAATTTKKAAAGPKSPPASAKASSTKKSPPAKAARVSSNGTAGAKRPAAKKAASKTPAKPAATKKPTAAKAAPARKAAAPAAKTATAPPAKAAPAAKKPAAPPAPKRPTTGPYAKEPKFLDEQRALLLEERSIYKGQAVDLRAEADSLALEREPGDVQFDEESGEGGTVTVDRERNLALSAQAGAAVEEIDDAMRKIDRKTYGGCERCYQPIPKARLRALPFARLCVACKSGGLSRR
jgi:RNA polymerase-binding transcription factor DksA